GVPVQKDPTVSAFPPRPPLRDHRPGVRWHLLGIFAEVLLAVATGACLHDPTSQVGKRDLHCAILVPPPPAVPRPRAQPPAAFPGSTGRPPRRSRSCRRAAVSTARRLGLLVQRRPARWSTIWTRSRARSRSAVQADQNCPTSARR